MLRSWFHLSCAWEAITALKEVTTAWLRHMPSVGELDVVRLYVYTDGSGGSQSRGQERAPAWAFSVFAADADMNQALVGYAARTAQPDPTAAWFCGVTGERGYAMELAAMTWALLWVARDVVFAEVPVTLCFDSTSAAQTAQAEACGGRAGGGSNGPARQHKRRARGSPGDHGHQLRRRPRWQIPNCR